jgi:mRNA-degrading endonuclease RelE of RelBE toxin-antitoxin system
MARRYQVEISFEAAGELRELPPFYRRAIVRHLRDLEYEAETRTRNRKPLEQPLPALPGASWEVRVGRHRVLYNVEGQLVSVLRVIIKEGTTEDSL